MISDSFLAIWEDRIIQPYSVHIQIASISLSFTVVFAKIKWTYIDDRYTDRTVSENSVLFICSYVDTVFS